MYSSYRLGRAIAAPFNAWAGVLRAFWSHPAFPISATPFGRAVATASELLERATRRYPKPPFGLTSTVIGGRPVAVREVVWDRTVRFIHAIGSDVHVIAVCQPSVPVLAAVSLMAEAGDLAAPLTMTLMAGPIDTRVNPTQVDRVATSRPLRWFELGAVHQVPEGEPGHLRRVYPGFLQLTAFVSLNP